MSGSVAPNRRKRAEEIPPGQPHAYPRTKEIENKRGQRLPKFIYPHQIVQVRSKKDLKEAFDHYGHPFPMMEGSVAPKNKYAMRYLIEWIYPALRWYCRVYQEPVPRWLQSNGWADGMGDEDQKKFFGERPLEVREFHEDKRKGGQRA